MENGEKISVMFFGNHTYTLEAVVNHNKIFKFEENFHKFSQTNDKVSNKNSNQNLGTLKGNRLSKRVFTDIKSKI